MSFASPAIAIPTLNINRVCKTTTIFCSYKDCVAALPLDRESSSASNLKAWKDRSEVGCI
ncbi:hypothetical protein Patl1_08010 [Pistacia atlantica]|uniref:Uncharacterized protein n=1 Tax=Pistacia atlantica TaxID=434234 RepID=A0ACC1AJ94_9ROSI|nr:hypothetical protein Patl1_08010 [Pistacia atlantica]